jgi:protein-L-isoaspartate(D-aspartate) O-methyltransferase
MRLSMLIVLALWLYPSLQEKNFSRLREKMVMEQIEQRGIQDPATLSSMRKVQRHLFVPDDLTDYAYDDRPLPIGYGQTISQPYIVAYMTEIIKPKPNYVVLEIGTGSGYQAAILSGIVKEVYSIEIIDSLASLASKRLGKLNYKNIHVRSGDGYHGWKDKSPFDAIVVTAAAEHIPPPLIAQLKENGRMIIPVGSPFMTQQLMLVEKKNGRMRTSSMMPVQFVPFKRRQ